MGVRCVGDGVDGRKSAERGEEGDYEERRGLVGQNVGRLYLLASLETVNCGSRPRVRHRDETHRVIVPFPVYKTSFTVRDSRNVSPSG